MTRRMSSHKVALSAAFLALAAGGTAACDTTGDYDETTYDSDTGGYSTGYDPADSTGPDAEIDDEEFDNGDGDEVFYCADDDGRIVDEDYCDDDGSSPSYFIWHSTGYSQGLRPGTRLNGGDYFPADDRAARRAFALPATGKIGSGTVKTNVVGRGSSAGGTTATAGG